MEAQAGNKSPLKAFSSVTCAQARLMHPVWPASSPPNWHIELHLAQLPRECARRLGEVTIFGTLPPKGDQSGQTDFPYVGCRTEMEQ